ncbi:MAG: hypothetical protein AB7P07_11875 [Hyphomonadaceae bacterium]
MIYLIEQLALWLVLAAGFAALAGWAYAGMRGAPEQERIRRERDGVFKDLLSLSVENAGASGGVVEVDRSGDLLRRRAELDAARIAELERSLEAARARAAEAASRIAELERAGGQGEDSPELVALREEVERLRARDEAAIPIEVQPVVSAAPPVAQPDQTASLQTWRLRYFEQRVKYLEGNGRGPAPAAEPEPADPILEWRARTAEARVAHLEDVVRAREAAEETAPVTDGSDDARDVAAFAADASADMLLRWRMLYLEKRAAYLNDALEAAPTIDADEAEKWKWRARYLEARVRYLESKPATKSVSEPAAPAPVAALPAESPAAPAASRPRGARPPSLAAARGGAPDDFTLIEGVSLMQQSTLNSLGIYHFDQIAAWTPENVAWIDQYLRLRGRIGEEEWLEQADTLAREGVAASRRLAESEEI